MRLEPGQDFNVSWLLWKEEGCVEDMKPGNTKHPAINKISVKTIAESTFYSTALFCLLYTTQYKYSYSASVYLVIYIRILFFPQ